VLHAQGGGTVCRRGGVDSDPGEKLRFGLTPWIWVRGEREVEVISEAYAHGAFFGFFSLVDVGDGRGKTLSIHLTMY
jgi:hypothetical protein